MDTREVRKKNQLKKQILHVMQMRQFADYHRSTGTFRNYQREKFHHLQSSDDQQVPKKQQYMLYYNG